PLVVPAPTCPHAPARQLRGLRGGRRQDAPAGAVGGCGGGKPWLSCGRLRSGSPATPPNAAPHVQLAASRPEDSGRSCAGLRCLPPSRRGCKASKRRAGKVGGVLPAGPCWPALGGQVVVRARPAGARQGSSSGSASCEKTAAPAAGRWLLTELLHPPCVVGEGPV